MRAWILSLALFTAVLVSRPALAAPTCLTSQGDTIRCGTQGAMPVGWTIPPEQRHADPVGDNETALLKVIAGLGLFLAFVALLPQFDGSRAEDWDRQEGDDGK